MPVERRQGVRDVGEPGAVARQGLVAEPDPAGLGVQRLPRRDAVGRPVGREGRPWRSPATTTGVDRRRGPVAAAIRIAGGDRVGHRPGRRRTRVELQSAARTRRGRSPPSRTPAGRPRPRATGGRSRGGRRGTPGGRRSGAGPRRSSISMSSEYATDSDAIASTWPAAGLAGQTSCHRWVAWLKGKLGKSDLLDVTAPKSDSLSRSSA